MSNLDELTSSPPAVLDPQDEVKIVGQYYDDKTERLVRKDGPGPRIHYHVGHYPSSEAPLRADDVTPDAIRGSIRLHQEGLLRYAAKIWDAEQRLSGRILDVGCGLGGGSLFGAQEYGADVTAVTNAPEHAPVLDGFAAAVRCGREGPHAGERREAYSPGQRPVRRGGGHREQRVLRPSPWFERLARVLRPGASVCVEEVFITRPHGADVWADYFYTKPATVLDYTRAAQAAGFELVDDVDATSETAPFWEESAAWTKALLDSDNSLSPVDRRQLRISLLANQALGAEWRAGGVRLGFLRFELK